MLLLFRKKMDFAISLGRNYRCHCTCDLPELTTAMYMQCRTADVKEITVADVKENTVEEQKNYRTANADSKNYPTVSGAP
jgi:hypothetical protein